jgi:hypothetical protein
VQFNLFVQVVKPDQNIWKYGKLIAIVKFSRLTVMCEEICGIFMDGKMLAQLFSFLRCGIFFTWKVPHKCIS